MKKLLLVCMLFAISVMSLQANTREEAELVKCVDGDTTHLKVGNEVLKVRYLAIDTPEYTKEKEPYGKEASECVCKLLSEADKIELEYDDGSEKTDKYGRTLAWVYADDRLVQIELVQQGLAEVKYIYGDYAYTDNLQKAQKAAQADKLNIWSNRPYEEKGAKEKAMLGIGGGVLLIVAGLLFAKNKSQRKRMIKKGMRKISQNSKKH